MNYVRGTNFQVGVYDVDPSQVILKSRLKPGRMLLVDTQEKTVIQDVELKQNIAKSRPHSVWLREQVKLLLYLLYHVQIHNVGAQFTYRYSL